MILWSPSADRRPGPAWKAGYAGGGITAPKIGEVKHSAEGYWPGIYARLDGPDRASWHFTVGYDRIEQHYPLEWNCWHAGDVDPDGGVRANIDLVGVEHLGVAGQPLTPYQLDATTRITRWMMDACGYARATRASPAGGWLLREHNEVSDEGTSCPSGRIPWAEIMARIGDREDCMPTPEYDELKERDEQIKVVLARVDAAVKFLIEIVADLAPRVD